MKKLIYHLAKEVFRVMTAGSLIFLLMELVKPWSVLAYLNWLLWLVIWLASAIIAIAFKPKA